MTDHQTADRRRWVAHMHDTAGGMKRQMACRVDRRRRWLDGDGSLVIAGALLVLACVLMGVQI